MLLWTDRNRQTGQQQQQNNTTRLPRPCTVVLLPTSHTHTQCSSPTLPPLQTGTFDCMHGYHPHLQPFPPSCLSHTPPAFACSIFLPTYTTYHPALLLCLGVAYLSLRIGFSYIIYSAMGSYTTTITYLLSNVRWFYNMHVWDNIAFSVHSAWFHS